MAYIQLIHFVKNKLVSINCKVIPVWNRGEIWFKFYPVIPLILFFLLTFIKIYQEFELLSITYIIMLYWEKVSKIFKNCSLRTLCRQKQDQHSPHPKSNPIFSPEIRRDHRLSRTFHLIKIYVLTEVWMILYLVWYLVAKSCHFKKF